jgi:3-methyladenine DNA glycosylase AlkD
MQSLVVIQNICCNGLLLTVLIQKAISWWLRVLGIHRLERVIEFLKIHWVQLKSLAKKEATRKLSVEWQQSIIKDLVQ